MIILVIYKLPIKFFMSVRLNLNTNNRSVIYYRSYLISSFFVQKSMPMHLTTYIYFFLLHKSINKYYILYVSFSYVNVSNSKLRELLFVMHWTWLSHHNILISIDHLQISRPNIILVLRIWANYWVTLCIKKCISRSYLSSLKST